MDTQRHLKTESENGEIMDTPDTTQKIQSRIAVFEARRESLKAWLPVMKQFDGKDGRRLGEKSRAVILESNKAALNYPGAAWDNMFTLDMCPKPVKDQYWIDCGVLDERINLLTKQIDGLKLSIALIPEFEELTRMRKELSKKFDEIRAKLNTESFHQLTALRILN
jgi:hypothetical protein